MFLNVKKTFTLLCTLMFALVLVGTSCKKDEDPTLDDLISAHAWKLTGQKNGGTPATLAPCDMDNIINFHDTGVYHRDEGATKCNSSDPQEVTGTWSISESTTPATLTTIIPKSGTSETLEYQLTLLESNKMVITIPNVPILGSLEFTFEKI